MTKLFAALLLATAIPAFAHPPRPAEDIARDAARHPAELAAFAGIGKGKVVADFIPGGLAQVDSDWIADDHLAIGVTAMGQFIPCDVHIEDRQMVVEIDLPAQLSFVAGMIEKGVTKTGMKMLT